MGVVVSTRQERADGLLVSGEMNARRFAEHIGVAHGTVKRWLHDGMPARREPNSGGTWITAADGAWISERFKGRKTVAFNRRAFVYLAEREDGLVKIGWSSDVMRRMHELRKTFRSSVQLLACFPADKPTELALHARFAHLSEGGEWYRPGEDLLAFVESMRTVAA